MQFVLALVLCWGLYARDLPTIANAALALAITFVPALLEREYDLPMDAGLVLWITTAVFLHALGTTGFYVTVGTWDTITHALSASIVAAAGYAFFRAVNVHTDHVHIPPTMMGVFILVFVLAAGVIWELFEFSSTGAQRNSNSTPSSSSTVSMTRFATSSSTPSAR